MHPLEVGNGEGSPDRARDFRYLRIPARERWWAMTRSGRGLGVLVGIGLTLGLVLARPQAQAPATVADIPRGAIALEGRPQVSVDVTKDGAQRKELDPADASKHRLRIRVVDGRFYWGTRDDRPLTVSSSGDFVYLSSAEPGRYVRFRRVNDALAYVEHVDTAFGSVTYWGELRIVLGK
jgi:hypothetical protein